MAYQTGTVASPTALKSVVEAFCVTNGWTLSAQDYLYKGLSNIKLTVPTGPSTTTLEITAANSSDGVTSPAGYSYATYIQDADWPVTYYLFAHTNPDVVMCVLQYNTNNIQPIFFGDIVKVHSDAFVGGNFFYAARSTGKLLSTSGLFAIAEDFLQTGAGEYGFHTSIPFPIARYLGNTYSGIHAEIDDHVWGSADVKFHLSHSSATLLAVSPNTWNNQATLIPFHLEYEAASSLTMYLGYIEHIRLIRIDNYEIGDIITLGTDKWKVFPWLKKDATKRNGNTALGAEPATGTVGFAVRYDGP